jgi:hypothetical protein
MVPLCFKHAPKPLKYYVSTAIKMWNAAFWIVTPCCPVDGYNRTLIRDATTQKNHNPCLIIGYERFTGVFTDLRKDANGFTSNLRNYNFRRPTEEDRTY